MCARLESAGLRYADRYAYNVAIKRPNPHVDFGEGVYAS